MDMRKSNSKFEPSSSSTKPEKAAASGKFTLFGDDDWSAVALRKEKSRSVNSSQTEKQKTNSKADAKNQSISGTIEQPYETTSTKRRLIKALPSTSSMKVNVPATLEQSTVGYNLSQSAIKTPDEVGPTEKTQQDLSGEIVQESTVQAPLSPSTSSSTDFASAVDGADAAEVSDAIDKGGVEVVSDAVLPTHKGKVAVDAHIVDVEDEEPESKAISTSKVVDAADATETIEACPTDTLYKAQATSQTKFESTTASKYTAKSGRIVDVELEDEQAESKQQPTSSITSSDDSSKMPVLLKKTSSSVIVPAVTSSQDVDASHQAIQSRIADPILSRSELDVKELEVLKQIKEFNAQQLAAEEEEGLEDYLDDDDEDDAFDGMHVEHHHATDSGEDESEEDDLEAKALGSEVKSRAIVRSAGNIAAFIRIANQIPMLTPEEERELAKRYRENGDIEAARRLVTSHLRLVVSVAHGYAGYGLPLPDLIQEGNVGLMKAVMHFEPDQGRLAAFAVHWIRASISDYVIRNWRMVKVATTKAQRKLFFNLRQLKKHLGWFNEQERKKIADSLGVSVADVAEMEMRLAGSDIGFDLEEDDSGGDKNFAVTLSPSSYLEDESSDFAENYENVDYNAWQIRKLKEALSFLDERSQYIIKRRWLDDNKATFQELSNELKVSIERVRQIESNAMNKIKLSLVNEGVKEDKSVQNVPRLPVKSTTAKTWPVTKSTSAANKDSAVKASSGSNSKTAGKRAATSKKAGSKTANTAKTGTNKLKAASK